MPKGQRKTVTFSKIGSYHINLGATKLHDWIKKQVKVKGCSSVPEYFKRLAQEAYERAQLQQVAPDSPSASE